MVVSFRNNSSDCRIKLNINDAAYLLEAGKSAEISVYDEKVTFFAEMLPEDLTAGWDTEETPKKLRDRILHKLARKFAEKIPELGLYSVCEYSLSEITDGMTVELYDGAYSVLDGMFSQWFMEMIPVVFTFARAEAVTGKLSFNRARLVNRKKYLKTVRNILLFLDLELFLANLLFFIPKYVIERFAATGICLTMIMKRLYSMPVTKRVHKINENLKDPDIPVKRSILSALIKVILIIAVIYGIGYMFVSDDIKAVDSIGSYEECGYYTSGGFIDYADYAKYICTEADFEGNEYFVQMTADKKTELQKYVEDFELRVEAIRFSDPQNELVTGYDFDASVISSDDFICIRNYYEDDPMADYDIYFFDSESMILYYFNNNK